MSSSEYLTHSILQETGDEVDTFRVLSDGHYEIVKAKDGQTQDTE